MKTLKPTCKYLAIPYISDRRPQALDWMAMIAEHHVMIHFRHAARKERTHERGIQQSPALPVLHSPTQTQANNKWAGAEPSKAPLLCTGQRKWAGGAAAKTVQGNCRTLNS